MGAPVRAAWPPAAPAPSHATRWREDQLGSFGSRDVSFFGGGVVGGRGYKHITCNYRVYPHTIYIISYSVRDFY